MVIRITLLFHFEWVFVGEPNKALSWSYRRSKSGKKDISQLTRQIWIKVIAIRQSYDHKELTITEMINKLQAEKHKNSIKVGDATQVAFQVRQIGIKPLQKDKKIVETLKKW